MLHDDCNDVENLLHICHDYSLHLSGEDFGNSSMLFERYFLFTETMRFGKRAAELAESREKSRKDDKVVVFVITDDPDCSKKVSVAMMSVVIMSGMIVL